MRDDYISNVKGGRLKRFSAFLADRDWSTTAGVSCVCHKYINYTCMLTSSCVHRWRKGRGYVAAAPPDFRGAP